MRKKLTAIVLAILAFSMIAASAATLGPITTSDLGAATDVVASCDSDGVVAEFTVGFSGGEYDVTAVNITSIATPACDNLDISVTLFDDAGGLLDSATGQVTTGAFNATGLNASAEAVEGIAVVIEG